MSILILGLTGSGKTTLAAEIRRRSGMPTIDCDVHRYGENSSRKSLNEYTCDVLKHITVYEEHGIAFVLEGSCNDTSDPENARKVVMQEIQHRFEKVIIIKPQGLEQQVESLIRRSLNRANSSEPQGACIETPQSAARLVLKAVQSYDSNVQALDYFSKLCKRDVYYDTRDNLYEILDAIIK